MLCVDSGKGFRAWPGNLTLLTAIGVDTVEDGPFEVGRRQGEPKDNLHRMTCNIARMRTTRGRTIALHNFGCMHGWLRRGLHRRLPSCSALENLEHRPHRFSCPQRLQGEAARRSSEHLSLLSRTAEFVFVTSFSSIES